MVQSTYGMARTRSDCAKCQATQPPFQRLHFLKMGATWQLLLLIPGSLASKSTLQMPFTSGKFMMLR